MIEQRRQLAELAGADDEIDMRGPAEDGCLVLLGHAADDADNQIGLLLLDAA